MNVIFSDFCVFYSDFLEAYIRKIGSIHRIPIFLPLSPAFLSLQFPLQIISQKREKGISHLCHLPPHLSSPDSVHFMSSFRFIVLADILLCGNH